MTIKNQAHGKRKVIKLKNSPIFNQHVPNSSKSSEKVLQIAFSRFVRNSTNVDSWTHGFSNGKFSKPQTPIYRQQHCKVSCVETPGIHNKTVLLCTSQNDVSTTKCMGKGLDNRTYGGNVVIKVILLYWAENFPNFCFVVCVPA